MTAVGGDFLVTITHTVQLRVPDLAVAAAALKVPPLEALVEIADDLGVKGLTLDARDALPLGSFEIVRVDRVTTDVDRIEHYAFSDGSGWQMRVPAQIDGGEPIGRPTTFVVTDAPLTEPQILAVRDLLRETALSNCLPYTAPRGRQQ